MQTRIGLPEALKNGRQKMQAGGGAGAYAHGSVHAFAVVCHGFGGLHAGFQQRPRMA
ncbi:hypothetical protein D3C85_1376910 [compost metagenome]